MVSHPLLNLKGPTLGFLMETSARIVVFAFLRKVPLESSMLLMLTNGSLILRTVKPSTKATVARIDKIAMTQPQHLMQFCRRWNPRSGNMDSPSSPRYWNWIDLEAKGSPSLL
uniref:Uncharacterized protein n=1 Tax=Rhizophora mucronata TaxID=61149 RepID=A0A2P2QB98_RHIMU